MDRQKLEQQLQTILDQVRKHIVEQASPSLRSMANMEQLIYSELDRSKSEVLQAWCDQAKDDSSRPLCPHCSGTMRHKGSRGRTLICEGGQVELKRTRWWCDACKASFFPLDTAATVAGYPVTPNAAQQAIEEATERSYEQAIKHLSRSHHVHMGKELLENLTKTVGDYWLEQDHQSVERAMASRTVPSEDIRGERCLVFADGVMVHTDGDWHEARVGTVCTEGVDGTAAKSSIARLCGVEEFGLDMWRHACRLGYRSASLTAFIADGSHWLWNLVDRHFKRAVKIVDFWHVCERVSECAKVFFGQGTDAAKRWSLKVCGHVRAGDVEGALGHVEALNPRSSARRRQQKHSLVTYLTNNRERMDYPRYEAFGFPIGSGQVEAACKSIVQARCKRSGMRWHSGGLEALLRVRCAVLDGRYWRDFGRWPSDLVAWRARRKRLRGRAA